MKTPPPTYGNIRRPRLVAPSMNDDIQETMDRGGIVDISTIGRKSGLERRIEIYFHHFDGMYYLTGKPGRSRDWMANIEATPQFVLHLKRGVTADVPVVGEAEPDPGERARILRRAMIESWNSPADEVDKTLQTWVDISPFIRFRRVD